MQYIIIAQSTTAGTSRESICEGSKMTYDEKMKSADYMAKLLSNVSKEDEAILLAITNAYADGLAAGRLLERDHVCDSRRKPLRAGW